MSTAWSECRQTGVVTGMTMVFVTSSFEMRAITPEVLCRLRERDDAGSAPRIVVDRAGGSPLRCCLSRTKAGETVGLVSYAPLRRWAVETGAHPGPYNEVGPVFIHLEDCGGAAREVSEGVFPDGVRGKRRVLRAYDADGSILGGRLVHDGAESSIEAELDELYRDSTVAIVHVRAVEFGCFLLETRRR